MDQNKAAAAATATASTNPSDDPNELMQRKRIGCAAHLMFISIKNGLECTCRRAMLFVGFTELECDNYTLQNRVTRHGLGLGLVPVETIAIEGQEEKRSLASTLTMPDISAAGESNNNKRKKSSYNNNNSGADNGNTAMEWTKRLRRTPKRIQQDNERHETKRNITYVVASNERNYGTRK